MRRWPHDPSQLVEGSRSSTAGASAAIGLSYGETCKLPPLPPRPQMQTATDAHAMTVSAEAATADELDAQIAHLEQSLVAHYAVMRIKHLRICQKNAREMRKREAQVIQERLAADRAAMRKRHAEEAEKRAEEEARMLQEGAIRREMQAEQVRYDEVMARVAASRAACAAEWAESERTARAADAAAEKARKEAEQKAEIEVRRRQLAEKKAKEVAQLRAEVAAERAAKEAEAVAAQVEAERKQKAEQEAEEAAEAQKRAEEEASADARALESYVRMQWLVLAQQTATMLGHPVSGVDANTPWARRIAPVPKEAGDTEFSALWRPPVDEEEPLVVGASGDGLGATFDSGLDASGGGGGTKTRSTLSEFNEGVLEKHRNELPEFAPGVPSRLANLLTKSKGQVKEAAAKQALRDAMADRRARTVQKQRLAYAVYDDRSRLDTQIEQRERRLMLAHDPVELRSTGFPPTAGMLVALASPEAANRLRSGILP